MQEFARDTYVIACGQGYFDAGKLPGGRQALVGVQLPNLMVLLFSAEGDFLAAHTIPIASSDRSSIGDRAQQVVLEWEEASGFQPVTIRVKPFFLDELWIGIRDLPEHYQDVIDNPDDFEPYRKDELLEDIREWNRSGSFVFYWTEDYYMSIDGEVESS